MKVIFGESVICLFYKTAKQISILMERSRRVPFIDIVLDRFIFTNTSSTLFPCFTVIPKTGMGLPWTGVSFSVKAQSTLHCSTMYIYSGELSHSNCLVGRGVSDRAKILRFQSVRSLLRQKKKQQVFRYRLLTPMNVSLLNLYLLGVIKRTHAGHFEPFPIPIGNGIRKVFEHFL